MIDAKRANRLTRQNRPTAIRVWRNETTEYQSKAVVLEIADPSTVRGHETLSRHVQRSLAVGLIRCQSFNGLLIDVPLDQIRLVLDTQITQEEHAETIIEPAERERLMRHLRDFIDEADIYGHSLRLAETPFALNELPTFCVVPPSIRLKSIGGSEIILPHPNIMSDESLRKRARDRAEHMRQHGFLQQRPINPLLAWPDHFAEKRARRMKADLEYIWSRQGIDFTFGIILYSDVEHLRREIERSGYDALFAVLPEGWRAPHRPDNTHEKIKQRIQIPSQCIQYDHTLPEPWVDKKPGEFRNAQPDLARRIRQQYELCLGNLLVKHHWIPFAPADPFYYNTHVGFDVGGRHNNQAMACLGHGFQRPREDLIFRPEEIPIDVQKAEPIPTECLYRGLLQLFEFVYSELTDAGTMPDFARTLFYRDGALLGDEDAWNERDALIRLHTQLLKRGWVKEDSVWTAVEILKRAEGWRILRNQGRVTNLLAGQCIFPFDEENMALVSTTGAPYLSQGTARPLMIRIVNIYGCAERDEVIRDLIWQADMCFTKPDTGMSLPWVLNVADTGALQTSRSYRISGIPI